MIGFAALLVLVAALLIYYFLKNKKDKNLEQNFEIKKQEVFTELKHKRMLFQQELYHDYDIEKQQLIQKLTDLNNQILQKQENVDIQIENLDNDLVEYRNSIQQERNKIIKEHQEKVIDEDRNYTERLKQIENNYKLKVQDLQQELEDFKNNVEDQKKVVLEELQKYQEKQNELVRYYKKEEEDKEKQNFYKIQLNDNEVKDIVQLKQLSRSFSKPEVLLKLIYEVYYKSKMEELFKRVLLDYKDKGGIYKITNINNQKTYIGKTVKFLDRWRTHAKRGCGIERIAGKLYDAMFEEGLENFTWEVIKVCEKEEQGEEEKYWINYFKSDEYGYNSKKGG